MLHPHLAHVEEVGNLVFVGELPGLLAQLGGLDVLAGGVVVQDDGNLVPVKDLSEARLLKLGDGHGGGDVVALHPVQPGVLGQYFLRHCHSHRVNYLLTRFIEGILPQGLSKECKV